MLSPPKPWESASAINNSTDTSNTLAQQSTPSIPTRPSSFADNSFNRFGNAYSSPYGSRLIGGYGGGYSSGYGGYGYGGYGGGYSGYGNYGGYGSGYGGYGGGYGPRPPPDNGSEAAFQVIEQFVQAFGGIAHMLESTFTATYSSYAAMMGMAEHFGHLSSFLGDFIPIFSFFGKIRDFVGRPSVDDIQTKKPSKKPFFIFLMVVFGIPYLMNRLINILQKRKQITPTGSETLPDIEFAKALYDFTAEGPREISFKKGDLIGVISKEGEWWTGKLRHGPIGYFPGSFVQLHKS
jgi:peroxin-13